MKRNTKQTASEPRIFKGKIAIEKLAELFKDKNASKLPKKVFDSLIENYYFDEKRGFYFSISRPAKRGKPAVLNLRISRRLGLYLMGCSKTFGHRYGYVYPTDINIGRVYHNEPVEYYFCLGAGRGSYGFGMDMAKKEKNLISYLMFTSNYFRNN